VKFKIEGLDKLLRGTAEFERRVAGGIDAAVATAALRIQGNYRKKLQRGGRSGRIYKRRGIQHQASAPGEPPKTDTGQLAASAVVVHEPGSRHAEVIVRAPYAAALEFGSPRSNLEPRPALGPAVREESAGFPALIAAKIKGAR
jgi:hypothetical protein